MALRSLIVIGGILFSGAFLLSGCGGSGGGPMPGHGGGGNAATFAIISSADGNAQLVDPIPGGFPPNLGIILPTLPAQPDPNAIPGTFYVFGPLPKPALAVAHALPVFPIKIKYDPSKLPAGVSPSQLAIVAYLPANPSPFNYVLAGNSLVDLSTHSVTSNVSTTGTYGLIATVPFTGLYTGRFSGTSSGTLSLTVVSSGTTLVVGGPDGSADTGQGLTQYSGPTTFTVAPQSGIPLTTFMGTFQIIEGHVKASGTWSTTSGGSGSWTIP
jgi:hypothetical protein